MKCVTSLLKKSVTSNKMEARVSKESEQFDPKG
jgi:hypothetical protein